MQRKNAFIALVLSVAERGNKTPALHSLILCASWTSPFPICIGFPNSVDAVVTFLLSFPAVNEYMIITQRATGESFALCSNISLPSSKLTKSLF